MTYLLKAFYEQNRVRSTVRWKHLTLHNNKGFGLDVFYTLRRDGEKNKRKTMDKRHRKRRVVDGQK